MRDLITILTVIAMVWAIGDVLRLMKQPVERVVWLVVVIAVPILGPAFWFYVQHIAVKQRRVRG